MPTPAALFREFLRLEAAGGILLVIATVLALVVANSAAAPLYDAALALPLTVKAGGFGVDKPLLLWINDGLMAVFFLVVGLEIKREVIEGELSSPAQASLPVIAAVGGMAVPALVYLVFNADSPATLKGWAIPAATDIAFALGVLSLLGPRVPLSLKVFLTALAIIDDLGAIIIIAVFYTASLSQEMLALAGAAMAALIACNLLGVRRIGWYLGIGTLLWLFVLKSGVHATLAGVALALTIPLKADGGGHSPAHALEHRLHGPVAYAILPVFAFANAGVPLGGIGLADVLAPLPLGVALGLFLGKQVGVFAFTWAAIRLRLARLPERATWTQIYGVSVLTGIGFTMSLFIGGLAFDDAEHAAGVRIGVLAGSLLSAVAGYALLRLAAGTATASGTAEATPGASV